VVAASGVLLLLVGQALAGVAGLVGAFVLVVALNALAAAVSGIYDGPPGATQGRPHGDW